MEMTPRELVELFTTMSAKDKEMVADALAAPIWASQRSRALDDAKQWVNTRVLQDGTEVTRSTDGTTVGLTGGKSQFDILNFEGFNLTIDSETNARQVNISGGGGGLPCYDYVVSECWADVVAAGNGTEGQAFTLATGCDTHIFSTVQGMIDYAEDTDTVSHRTALICPGSYAGMTFDTFDREFTIVGLGRRRTELTTLTLSGSVNFGGNKLRLENMDFTSTVTLTAGSSRDIEFRNVRFGVLASIAVGSAGVTSFFDCEFNATVTGGSATTVFQRCKITAQINTSSNCQIKGCTVSGAGKLVIPSSSSLNTSITIEGNTWTSGASGTQIAVNGYDQLTIANNRFDSPPAGTSGTIVFTNSITGSRSCSITGNTFEYSSGVIPHITSQSTATEGVIIAGNSFSRNSTQYIEDNGGYSVTGTFNYSIFGPNAPGTKARYNVTGVGNEFYPQTSSSGGSTLGLGYINEIYISLGETYAVQF